MDLALRKSREHFEQNIVDGEEVRSFVNYDILYTTYYIILIKYA